jgi:hypothetical protein
MKTARDLILELYKEDHITKEETDILLNAISTTGTPTTFIPYADWTYKTYEQPYWTITSNTDNTNVE